MAIDATLRQEVQWVVRVSAQCIVIFGAAVLLGLHVGKVAAIRVDQNAVILLGLILLVPLVGSIKKLKYGDAEAEIEPGEVKQLAKKVEEGLARSSAVPKSMAPRAITPAKDLDLVELTKQDSVLGLAKLRIELEKRLRRLSEESGLPTDKVWVGAMLRNLERAEAIPGPLAGAVRDILPLANSAVHGASIRREDAIRIAELGVQLLQEFDSGQS